MKHFGDPCIYCDTPMSEFEIGECPGRPGLERTADMQMTIDALLEIVDRLNIEKLLAEFKATQYLSLSHKILMESNKILESILEDRK